MAKFNHTYRKIWSGGRFLGLILISMGLVVVLTPLFMEVETEMLEIGLVAGIPMSIGLILISTYRGTLLDFQNRMFKEYQSILWFKLGEWEELPKIEQVEMVLHSFRSRNVPNGVSPTLSSEITIYKCVLIAHSTKFLALDFASEKDAIAAIQKIRAELGLA